MNKTISIIRIAVLLALGALAAVLILGQEPDTDTLAWTFRFIVDKALGVGTIFLIARLYKRWSKIDPLFIAYNKMCDRVMDSPNPSQR